MEGTEERAAEIFQEALGLAPRERAELLERACRDDPALRARVEALLQADAEAQAFLQPPELGESDPGASIAPLRPGAVVGRYEIVRWIAAGGMADVYEAVQAHPRRTVALKVMRSGLGSPSAVQRFTNEAEILARLRHPNVAQVHEAGVLDAGGRAVPFLAMEVVPGALAITEFARAARLDRRARLELFLRVCDAVHHGHQRGVIHRDLKPANVLVDATGVVKVIDFGIARASGSDLAARTMPGELLGTLQSMSPEQVHGDPRDVDAQSDVYALGLLLYELLCGRLPYELSGAGAFEALRRIREEPPVRPSSVDRSLGGDLEWILLRALEKEPARRYEGAHALADDVRRHLANEPVRAGPPSAAYRARKFVRRNRGLVAGLAAAFLLLALGLAGTSLGLAAALRAERSETDQRRVAERETEQAELERAKAERLAEFLEETLEGVAPSVALGRDTRLLRDLMDRAAARVHAGELAAVPEAELRLRLAIGGVYLAIGALDAAESLLVPAVALAQRVHGSGSAEHARALVERAWWLSSSGRWLEAQPGFEQALEIRRRLFPGDHPLVASSLLSVARCRSSLARYREALQPAEEALAMWRRLGHEDDAALAATLDTLARCQWHPRPALAYAEEALAIRRRLYSGDHPSLARDLLGIGEGYEYLGRSAEGLLSVQEAVAMNARLYPKDHSRRIDGLSVQRACFESLGRFEEALEVSLEMLAMAQRAHREDHYNVARGLFAVAWSLQSLGRPFEALPHFEESLALRRHIYAQTPKHEVLSQSIHGVAICLTSLERAEESIPLFHEAIAIRCVLLDEVAASHYECGLAVALIDLGRLAEAETLLAGAWTTYAEEGLGVRRSVLRFCAAAQALLFERRHAAEPLAGHDARAALWRALHDRIADRPEATPEELAAATLDRVPAALPLTVDR